MKVILLTLLATCLLNMLNTPLPPRHHIKNSCPWTIDWSAHNMHHPYQHTHTITGQHHHHVHHHLQRPDNGTQHQHINHTNEDQYKEDSMRMIHTKQLDYLYVQLDSLKKNMKYKQTSLAKVGQHTLVFSVIYHY